MKRWLAHYRHSALFRHLTWVLVLKIVGLWLIWQLLIAPNKQHPDAAMVADHLLSKAQTTATSTTQPTSVSGATQ